MPNNEMNLESSARLEVHFPVGEDEPVASELMWCNKNSDGTVTIDNIPFYARDVSIGDVIAVESRNGELWFNGVVKPSSNTTVRVIGMRKKAFDEIISTLRNLGGEAEKMHEREFAAVSFPPSADLAAAFEFLDRESEEENLGFEESAVRYRS
jgi:hypothetical protein